MKASFWLGIFAGIFGILGALIAILLGSIGTAFNVVTMSNLYYNAIGAIAFSTLGMLGGIPLKRTRINAAIMIIAAVGVFVSEFTLGILPAMLFFVGAVLLLSGADDDIGEKDRRLGGEEISSTKTSIETPRTREDSLGLQWLFADLKDEDLKKRVKRALQWLSEDRLISFLSVVAVISIVIALILYAVYSGLVAREWFGFTLLLFIVVILGAGMAVEFNRKAALKGKKRPTYSDITQLDHCENCGAEIIAGSSYCSQCGTGFDNIIPPVSQSQERSDDYAATEVEVERVPRGITTIEVQNDEYAAAEVKIMPIHEAIEVAKTLPEMHDEYEATETEIIPRGIILIIAVAIGLLIMFFLILLMLMGSIGPVA